MGRWSAAEDAKLVQLFKEKKLDPLDLDKKAVEKARGEYFPQCTYKNFAPLYRKKCRKWNLEQTLAGKRSGRSLKQTPGKKRAATEDEDEKIKQNPTLSTAEDSDTDEEWEEEDLDDDKEQEEEESNGEEDQGVGDEEVEELAEDLEATQIDSTSTKMKLNYLYLDYKWFDENGQEHVTVDFLVYNMSQDMYRARIHPSGKYLELGTVVPASFLFNPGRLVAATRNKTQEQQRVSKNHHKATALANKGREIEKEEQNDHDEKIIIYQRVKLPIKVKQNFRWEVQVFTHDDFAMAAMEQLYFVLTVELISVVEPKQQNNGGSMRIVGSIDNSGAVPDETESGDADYDMGEEG